MPNKKTKTVKIRHLECFSAIYGELAQNPEYAGYEIEEAVLQVKSYIPPAVKDVDKAIEKISKCVNWTLPIKYRSAAYV